MDPKYYKDDYLATNVEELEFFRTPFYELAR
jgi:hypothetical protein